MQKIEAYKDGSRWVIVVEDSDASMDDVIKSLLNGFKASEVKETAEEGAGEATCKAVETPAFVRKLESVAEPTKPPVSAPETASDKEEEVDEEAYNRTCETLRKHAKNEMLKNRLQKRYGTTDIEQIIATRPKSEILTLIRC